MSRAFSLGLILILAALTVYRCFHDLGNRPFSRWDESTNATVIYDSVALRSFPFLVLNGKPFFEKPPLWYWTGYLTAQFFPVTPMSMRIVSAVSGSIVIMLTAAIAYIGWGYVAGAAAWIILLSANQLFVRSPGGFFSTHTFRSADTDALLVLLLTVTAGMLMSGRVTRTVSAAVGILTGFAVLTKGPIALTVISVYTVRQIVMRAYTEKSSIIRIWFLTLLTATPWYLLMYALFGQEFISTHFYYHVASRFFIPLEGHANNFWYYGSIITHPAVFPGFFAVFVSVIWIIYRKLYRSDNRIAFCLTLMCVFIIIPSAAQTKLAWYVLPFYPFAAITAGAAISDIFRCFSAGSVYNRHHENPRRRRRTPHRGIN